MQGRYQRFTEEFCAFMTSRAAWPKGQFIERHMRARTGCASGSFGAMRKGRDVPVTLVAVFVQWLAREKLSEEQVYSRTVLLEFLRERGVTSLDELSDSAILGHICHPASDQKRRTDEASTLIDYLAGGIFMVSHFMRDITSLDRYLMGCRPADIAPSIEWIFERVGRLTSPEGPALDRYSAIAAGADRIREPIDRYVERAIEWHRFNPWTIVRAGQFGSPLGVAINLPLKKSTFEAIRKGQKVTYECSSDDLQVPSQYILTEACAEHPDCVGMTKPNPTRALFVCMMHAIAALSRPDLIKQPRKLHLLSFAGTPLGRRRLSESGYKPTGCRMPRTDVELMEFEMTIPSYLGTELLPSVFFTAWGRAGDSPPYVPATQAEAVS